MASDVRIAIHQMRLMRKALLFMAAFTVMLLIGMFASSYMAIQLSKDLSVQTGRLVDKKGHDVSTIEHVDMVTGISDASRRLAETGNPVSESEGVLKIGKTYFEKTLAGFSDGKIERVASLPDGSSRKVTILGSEGKVAWGVCGSWPYLVDWVVHVLQKLPLSALSITRLLLQHLILAIGAFTIVQKLGRLKKFKKCSAPCKASSGQHIIDRWMALSCMYNDVI